MGDTTGKGADGFHLLRLLKLGFQFLLFTDISQIEDNGYDVTIPAMIKSATDTHWNYFSILCISTAFKAGEVFS